MRIHILGICGTFMGGLALLAKQMGFVVTGSDENIYPPMSTMLKAAGVEIFEGYETGHLKPAPDLVLIGNVMSRGNPVIEYVLNKGLRYTSGPQWLSEQVLIHRKVLAVSGTHGKTTTSSMLAWILTQSDLNPGYLIGGIPKNFERSANLGQAPFFVIEADEYDCAFFDKRSKFLHYRPRVLAINNLEYDHADIFPDINAIKTQFHYLLRIVPGCGSIIIPAHDPEIDDVVARGCWSTCIRVGSPEGVWQARHINADASRFEVWHRDQKLGTVDWEMLGEHNVHNALTAIAASHEIGLTADRAINSLRKFKGVKRRMELIKKINDISIYDDFAHHPTAIAATLKGLRSRVNKDRIFAVVQFGSNTMKLGANRDSLPLAFKDADQVILLKPESNSWSPDQLVKDLGSRGKMFNSTNDIIQHLSKELKASDHVLIMSNKGFEGLHQRLINQMDTSMEMV